MKDLWFQEQFNSIDNQFIHVPTRIARSKRDATELVDEIFDDLKYTTAHLPSREGMGFN